jgi:chemotaxis signal transduction protein
MPKSTAWILDLGDGLCAAVGERQALHTFNNPELFDIPATPPHCRQVLIWRDHILPVMDVAAWLRGRAAQARPPGVVIVAFQDQPGQPSAYGALALTSIPRRTWVSDEQACELPADLPGWQRLAISCFAEGDRQIPILDLPYIFSGALIDEVRPVDFSNPQVSGEDSLE